MDPVRSAPVEWPVMGEDLPAYRDLDPLLRDSATEFASQVLWALSGRQYGLVPVVLRPLGRRPQRSVQLDWAGGWSLFGGGARPSHPFAQALLGARPALPSSEVDLPGPVHEVSEVLVDGEAVTSFVVDGGRTLIRTDGGFFPWSQPLDRPATEVGTFQVSYVLGAPLPHAGQVATAALAVEVAKAMSGQPCSLPRNARSVTRQGVSLEVGDPQQLLENGKTGVYLVDQWLKTANPYGLVERSRVFSVDRGRDGRVTSP